MRICEPPKAPVFPAMAEMMPTPSYTWGTHFQIMFRKKKMICSGSRSQNLKRRTEYLAVLKAHKSESVVFFIFNILKFSTECSILPSFDDVSFFSKRNPSDTSCCLSNRKKFFAINSSKVLETSAQVALKFRQIWCRSHDLILLFNHVIEALT
ncbi:MAG: hypothetical protein DRI57_16620 [Deltaproteobacteria bacterium]|nr:MAG: hypothetical protein DRI57_16620 [Deltaproteobacteria bacterium]